MSTGSDVWAIVPARPLEEGKSRLASSLSPAERIRLNESFFRNTLEITAAVLGRDRVLTVSRSPGLLAAAAALGVETLVETPPYGLNQALEQAAAEIAARGAEAILSISCDLPFLGPDDLRAMLDSALRPGVTIAGDRAGTGTNALLVSPGGAIPYLYGEGSLAAHEAAARRAGLAVATLRRPGLAFDLDTPDDLDQMEEFGRDLTHARLHAATAPRLALS